MFPKMPRFFYPQTFKPKAKKLKDLLGMEGARRVGFYVFVQFR
jgi:hypothetical protein